MTWAWSYCFGGIYLNCDGRDIALLANTNLPKSTAVRFARLMVKALNAQGTASVDVELAREVRRVNEPLPSDHDGERSAGWREAVARIIHEAVAGSDPDELIHAPWQNSWDAPTMKRWEQWGECVDAIAALPDPLKEGVSPRATLAGTPKSAPPNLSTMMEGAMSDADIPHYEDLDDDECGNCGGEGGYPVCQEDCCPHIYGEEGCDDPACWRVCSECRGRG